MRGMSGALPIGSGQLDKAQFTSNDVKIAGSMFQKCSYKPRYDMSITERDSCPVELIATHLPRSI